MNLILLKFEEVLVKLACYSDLHLEFLHDWRLPKDLDADVLILAGDIIIFNQLSLLKRFLRDWHKPILFVSGNHEYYTKWPMFDHHDLFRVWLARELPQVHFLYNEYTNISGINFFGGTMWTDFKGGDYMAKSHAASSMNDFRLICRGSTLFTPDDSIELHKEFITALTAWFEERLPGPRVVITHHAPVANPDTQYTESPLQPAFVANDTLPLIEKYQPDLWIYGHTHECDQQCIGKTQIISNQLGYLLKPGGYEGGGKFDAYGGLRQL